MAKKPGKKPAAELREEIARSREQVARRVNRVREEVDLPRKIRRSVRREPVPWIIGAIAVGLLLTAVATRRKKVYVNEKSEGSKGGTKLLEAGFVLGVLRVAATLFKPVIVNFVQKKLGGHTGKPPSTKRF